MPLNLARHNKIKTHNFILVDLQYTGSDTKLEGNRKTKTNWKCKLETRVQEKDFYKFPISSSEQEAFSFIDLWTSDFLQSSLLKA